MLFWKKKINNLQPSQELIESLLVFYKKLKQNTKDSSIIADIMNIIQGLELRMKMIHGQIVYENTAMSIAFKIQQMSQVQRTKFNKCFYYMDKIFYKMDQEK